MSCEGCRDQIGTPLQAVEVGGQTEIVVLLLEYNAKDKSLGGHYGTAFGCYIC